MAIKKSKTTKTKSVDESPVQMPISESADDVTHEEVSVEEVTPEEVEQHYSALLDSVNLINRGNVHELPEDEWDDAVDRNTRHIALMVSMDFWGDQDLGSARAILEK